MENSFVPMGGSNQLVAQVRPALPLVYGEAMCPSRMGEDTKQWVYKFEAKVDWVEVRVNLKLPSQPRHVRSRMPKAWDTPYVKADTDHKSQTATTFVFRVQNPQGPKSFMSDLQFLCRKGQSPLTEADVEILAVEVALDGSCPAANNSTHALLALLEVMLWGQTLLSSWPRVISETGSSGMVTRTKFQNCAVGRYTMTGGRENADFRQRWYFKDYDTLPTQRYKKLDRKNWRARYEVTLSGDRCPFKTISDWQKFEFGSLRTPYFSWRSQKRPVNKLPSWMDEFPMLGLPLGAEKLRQDRRKTKPGTVPNKWLQAQAKNALEKLSRSQRKG